MYSVVREVHEVELKHGGYKKVMDLISKQYACITRPYMQEFCATCPTCQLRHPQKSRPPLRPIVESSFLARVYLYIYIYIYIYICAVSYIYICICVYIKPLHACIAIKKTLLYIYTCVCVCVCVCVNKTQTINNKTQTTQTHWYAHNSNIKHHITSHHITSHHITSHHITSHHITSHHITSHHITSHHIHKYQTNIFNITYIMIQSLRGLLTSYSNHRRLLTLCAAHTDILQLAGWRGALIVTQNMFMQSANLSMYLLAKIIIKTHDYVINIV